MFLVVMFVSTFDLPRRTGNPANYFPSFPSPAFQMLSIWAKYTSGPEKLPLDASGLNLCSQFRISQPECVANDGYGTQAHRRARDDGTKEQAEKWVEQTCRDRNSQRVIDEREEKILPDVSHHRTAQVYGLGDAKQVAFHERNSRAFHRHVCAGPHGDANMRGGQCWRVVDAITGHRNDLTLLPELLDALVFVLRFNACFHLIESEFLGHGVRSALVVAGEHDDFQTELVKLRDGFGRGCLDEIGHRENSRSVAIDGGEHCRLSFRLQRRCLLFDSFQSSDTALLQKL